MTVIKPTDPSKWLLPVDRNSSFLSPPIPLMSDYVQMIYFTIIFTIGAPLNLYTLYIIVRQYWIVRSRFLLLSVNLNLSNLVILIFFTLAKICWLLTYKWMAGAFVCKVVKFAQSLGFMLSSNVVVCIGLDRLFTLMQPIHMQVYGNEFCKKMLTFAWLLAFVFSAPQLYVWTVYNVNPEWAQCVDVWQVWNMKNATSSVSLNQIKTAYNAVHLLVVFWIPLTAVIVCYVIILYKVFKKLGNDDRHITSPNQHIESAATSVNTKLLTVGGERLAKTSIDRRRRHLTPTTSYSQRQSMSPQCSSGHSSAQNSRIRVKRTKYRTLKLTILIVAAYVVCWLPYNVLCAWNILAPSSYLLLMSNIYFFYGLISVNTIVNPFLYTRLTGTCFRCRKFIDNNQHLHMAG